MKSLDFFYDFSSPYSYLAATQMQALGERTGAAVRWRPMVLGAVFKANGAAPPIMAPNKARWQRDDLERWARHYGVPMRLSSHFPVNAIKAMRLALVDETRVAAVSLAAFRAMWVDDRDLGDDAVVRALAVECGLDGEAAMAAIEEPRVKDQLRANTAEAIGCGAFGAPAFLVGGELFWGNDRLHFVEAAVRALP